MNRALNRFSEITSRRPLSSIAAIAPLSPGSTARTRASIASRSRWIGGVRPLQQRVGRRRRDDLDGAAHEAGRADALEVHVARKIVAVGRKRLQRRIEQRLDFDEAPGGGAMPRLTESRTRSRLVLDAVAVDPLDADHHAIGMLALLAQFDKAGDGHAGSIESAGSDARSRPS